MRPGIEVVNLQQLHVPDKGWFEKLFVAIEEIHGQLPQLSIALVDDAKIIELHGEFLGTPQPTDVISFPLEDNEGEVVVSVETAAREAERLKCSTPDELALYVLHGVLHLMGFDDKEAGTREKMIAAEKKVMERLGLKLRDRKIYETDKFEGPENF